MQTRGVYASRSRGKRRLRSARLFWRRGMRKARKLRCHVKSNGKPLRPVARMNTQLSRREASGSRQSRPGFHPLRPEARRASPGAAPATLPHPPPCPRRRRGPPRRFPGERAPPRADPDWDSTRGCRCARRGKSPRYRGRRWWTGRWEGPPRPWQDRYGAPHDRPSRAIMICCIRARNAWMKKCVPSKASRANAAEVCARQPCTAGKGALRSRMPPKA